MGGQLGAKPSPLLFDKRPSVPGDRRGQPVRGRPSQDDFDRFAVADRPHGAWIGKQARIHEAPHLLQEAGPDHGVDPGDNAGVQVGRGKLQAHEPDVPACKGALCLRKVGSQLGQRPSRGKAALKRIGHPPRIRGVEAAQAPRVEPAEFGDKRRHPSGGHHGRDTVPYRGGHLKGVGNGREEGSSGRTRSRPQPAPNAPVCGFPPLRPAPSRRRWRRSSARSRPGRRSGDGARGRGPQRTAWPCRCPFRGKTGASRTR